MQFVETSVFTRVISSLLADDEYRRLQFALVCRPAQGALIRGSGGLRKIRWYSDGSGKRGGVRVIYYWYAEDETFFMLYAYAKSEREDLTSEQLRALSALVRRELK